MRVRTTLGLLAAALVLGVVLAATEWGGPGRARREREARLALRLRAAQVEALEIEAGELRARCERDGPAWRLVAPIEAPADAATVERILGALEALERRAVIGRAEREREGRGLEVFGFDRPRARFVVEEPGAVHAFLLGRPSAVGDSVYLLDEATEDIVAVPAHVARLVPERVEDLRDRTLLAFEPARIRRIDLQRPEGFVRLGRGEGGEWRLLQPVEARAEPAVVQALLSLLAGTRAAAFLRESPGEDAVYGFDESAVAATLSEERPESEARTLEIGGPVDDESGLRHARVRSAPGIHAVAGEVYDHLRISVDGLRDRRLLDAAPEAVRGVRVQDGERRLALRRAADGWRIVEPADAPADAARVEAFARNWLDARAERFLPPGEIAGDETPPRRLAFVLSAPTDAEPEAERTRMFEIGRPDADGLIPVRCADGTEQAAVSPLRMRGFTADPLAFASNRPLRPPPGGVHGFTVSHEGREWTVTAPEGGAPELFVDDAAQMVDPVAALHRVGLLAALPAARLVALPPDPADDFGLAEPATTVRVHGADGTAPGPTLLLGDRGPDGVYARVLGEDLVFTVDPTAAELLRRPPVADGRP